MSFFVESLACLRPEIEAALDRLLPAENEHPSRIHQAMRYSVFAGGKRVRPALVVMVGEALGAERDDLLPVGAAAELLHTYSLIHDDLPAMDDDDLRRGRASLHRQFDEATAILAGDALLTLGLTALATQPEGMDAEGRLRAVQCMGEALGTRGMIGGQVDDLAAEGRWPKNREKALDAIHDRKTGALLAACLQLGGGVAGASHATLEKLGQIGFVLGRMFQIADDILDGESSEKVLGKTIGKDALVDKLTYPALYGLRGSRERLEILSRRSLELADALPEAASIWPSVIDYFSSREH